MTYTFRHAKKRADLKSLAFWRILANLGTTKKPNPHIIFDQSNAE